MRFGKPRRSPRAHACFGRTLSKHFTKSRSAVAAASPSGPPGGPAPPLPEGAVSYTHLRAHETGAYL
eukprot:3473971-Pyramimonas_sp.AAC.1